MDRRGFLKTTALSTAAVSLGAPGLLRATGAPVADDIIRLGVASYSLRNLSREEAIDGITRIGARYVNIKSFHLDYGASPEEITAARRQFEDAGIEIVGGGLIPFHEDTDEALRDSFDYARACGYPIIVAGPRPEVLPRLEQFAVEYDIRIAIHNHGPEDEFFPAPEDALALVRDMDPRMGVCVDVGHTARTGLDVVQQIAISGARLHDIHMKDLADFSDRGSQCVVGQGLMPVAAIFRQLMPMDYAGYVNLEYEIDANAPVPGMQRSFDYMRGVMDGLGAAAG